jgi:hypothetical protein
MTTGQYWEVGTEMDKSYNLWILKDRLCGMNRGGEPLFPSFYDFSPLRLGFIGNLTLWQARPGTAEGRSSAGLNDLRLVMYKVPNTSLSSHPHEGKSVSYFHCVKRGILGVGTVHRFGPDWVDGRSIS